MELITIIFLSSGLLLGWSLGANDAANVFGTAVGTKMVRFTTAAWICAIMVTLGAVVSGAGASHTLGKLGSITALGGAFTVALSAAVTVYWMTKASLPVSTSQAIVGAIIGWNLFSNTPTDPSVLSKIVGTWFLCPILSAFVAVGLYRLVNYVLHHAKLGLFQLDNYTRIGLLLAGAFGSYSLGANNIANVMGVFVPQSPFESFYIFGIEFSSTAQLFLIGGIAIGVGVFTYSRRVMMTVGDGLMTLTPVLAWVVVMAHSIVLFLFASSGLKEVLDAAGLPSLPLVPVSSSQAVIGAVIGLGLYKKTPVKWGVAMRIVGGWFSTPIISMIVCGILLFFVKNLFQQQVV
ncbi:inorganic phosphate transporter [Thalassotalea aquiviva]|uniref:inorganic phosphate transporter n=1 Tax=Thalassotalea aquiviva TaxID=3242415 RepID=UPI00352B30A8